jgi:hypothetical protein
MYQMSMLQCTSIGTFAFTICSKLTSIIIPSSVTSIGDWEFESCASLTAVYFQGNAPGAGQGVFGSGSNPTVFYLPGTTGWGTNVCGQPAVPWYLPNPLILGNGLGLGVNTNSFAFTISWATNTAVIVEASTNLLIWTPVTTNALVNGTNYFSDPQWTNYPGRFYRLRSP